MNEAVHFNRPRYHGKTGDDSRRAALCAHWDRKWLGHVKAGSILENERLILIGANGA